MKLSKYKILAILFLNRRWNSNLKVNLISSPQFFSSLIGSSYRQTLIRLKSQGLVEYSQGTPNFQLSTFNSIGITYRGINDLLLRFPALDCLDRAWDKKLTLAVFNISEKNRKDRDRLRYSLKVLGFGRINRSLYLSPHLSVKETTHLMVPSDSTHPAETQAKLEGFSFAFSVPLESLQGLESLYNFWNLTTADALYDKSLRFWISNAGNNGNSNYKDYNLVGGFLSKFIEALLIDPLLPLALLPKNWSGTQAQEIASKIIAG